MTSEVKLKTGGDGKGNILSMIMRKSQEKEHTHQIIYHQKMVT
uniref:Uncharacterized protein n=1 Tax=Escherichia coli TaxID=562 RepID=X5FX18_ECOLX|nr:hypothetical protein [Escherichia coli]